MASAAPVNKMKLEPQYLIDCYDPSQKKVIKLTVGDLDRRYALKAKPKATPKAKPKAKPKAVAKK